MTAVIFKYVHVMSNVSPYFILLALTNCQESQQILHIGALWFCLLISYVIVKIKFAAFLVFERQEESPILFHWEQAEISNVHNVLNKLIKNYNRVLNFSNIF